MKGPRRTDLVIALVAAMGDGERAACLHRLAVTYPAAPRAPRTMSADEIWWRQKLVAGRLLPEGAAWPAAVRCELLTDDYVENARPCTRTRRGSETSLGRLLHKFCPRLTSLQRLADVPTGDGRTEQRRCYFYKMPTLEGCREHWAELYGETPWRS